MQCEWTSMPHSVHTTEGPTMKSTHAWQVLVPITENELVPLGNCAVAVFGLITLVKGITDELVPGLIPLAKGIPDPWSRA